MEKIRGEKVYHSFKELDSKKFPDEDRRIHRICNLSEFQGWENINIWHYGYLISPRDVVAIQYYAAQNIEKLGLEKEYGSGKWQDVHYMVVSEMSLRRILSLRKDILEIYKKGFNTAPEQIESRKKYESVLEQISKKLPAEIVDNLWRNEALANFITIINSTKKRKHKHK